LYLLVLINDHLLNKYPKEVMIQPIPYFTLLEKLIEEESVEYFVGHVIFAISKSSKGFLSDQS
jgi:hypothetical protein